MLPPTRRSPLRPSSSKLANAASARRSPRRGCVLQPEHALRVITADPCAAVRAGRPDRLPRCPLHPGGSSSREGSGPQEAAGTGEPGRDAISKRALLPSPRRPWRLSSMPAPGKLDGACEWPGGGEKPQKASRCLPHPQPRGLQTALDRALLQGNRPEDLVFLERCRFSGDSLALPGRQCAPARTKHSRVEMLLWLWPGLPTSSSPPPAARATFLQTAQPDRSLPT